MIDFKSRRTLQEYDATVFSAERSQCISISLFGPVHSDTGYYPVSVDVCDQFNNTSSAQSYAGIKDTGRRESKNVGFHGGVTCRANEKEGRRLATGRKLVSFVKFLERKVPFGFAVSFVISLVLESRICPLPYSALSCPDRNLSRMVQKFTTRVLFRTRPLLYIARPPI